MPPVAPPRGVHAMPDNGGRNGAPPPLPGEWNPQQQGGQQGMMPPPAPQLLSTTGVLKVRSVSSLLQLSDTTIYEP